MSTDSSQDPTGVDCIVIGAGSGGLTVAVGLSRFGRRVLLVEADRMGGDCTNTGCIPSKSLLHLSAEFEHHHSSQQGVAEVLRRVRQRRDDLQAHEVEEFGGMDGIDLVFGTARMMPAGSGDGSGPQAGLSVSVTDADGSATTYRAPDVVVATGSSPNRLPVPGLPSERYLTNEELFELPEPPERLVVVGAGAVGMEMAVAFNRLGTQVHVLEAADRVMPTLLPEASAVLARALSGQGVDLRPGLVAHSFDPDGNRLHVGPIGRESVDTIEDVDAVLVAVGRRPNTADLGLEALGARFTDSGHLWIDDRGRTSVRGLWAVGDVTDRGGTTHMANAWGRRIIQAIALPRLPVGGLPLQPGAAYTDPEAAFIGVQPEEVDGDVMRITVDVAGIDRAYTDERKHGIVVVDVRRLTGTVLGATIVGPRAGELIALFSLAMKNGIPFHRWYGTVMPYPTYGEAVSKAVDQYLSATMGDLGGQVTSWLGGRFGSVRRRLANRLGVQRAGRARSSEPR